MDLPGSWIKVGNVGEKTFCLCEQHDFYLKVRVKAFSEETWDVFLNERLIENFDTKKEAVQRAETLMEKFTR